MTRDAPLVLVLLTAVIGIGLLAAGRDNGRPSGGSDAHSDFSGNWELNVTRSKFGKMSAPYRMSLETVRHGSALHSVQTTYDQTGGPEAIEGDWYPDGKERLLGSDGKMTSTSRWDGAALVSERKSKDSSYDETIHLTLSRDGKQATEEIQLKSPNGDNKSILIWERK